MTDRLATMLLLLATLLALPVSPPAAFTLALGAVLIGWDGWRAERREARRRNQARR